MMKSQESLKLVTKHVLQGVPEVSMVCSLFALCNKICVEYSQCSEIILREGAFRSFNQSNNQSLYLRVSHGF